MGTGWSGLKASGERREPGSVPPSPDGCGRLRGLHSEAPRPDGCGRLWETVIIRAGEYLDETEERTKTEAEAKAVHATYVDTLRKLG